MTITVHVSLAELYLCIYLIAAFITGAIVWVKVIRRVGMRDAYTSKDTCRVRIEYYANGIFWCAGFGITWPPWLIFFLGDALIKLLRRPTPAH